MALRKIVLQYKDQHGDRYSGRSGWSRFSNDHPCKSNIMDMLDAALHNAMSWDTCVGIKPQKESYLSVGIINITSTLHLSN